MKHLHSLALLEKKVVYYPHPKSWEKASMIIPELSQSLTRVPDLTPLGEMSTWPKLRDDVPIPGTQPWFVPDDFPVRTEPPLDTCTKSYKKTLAKHLKSSVDKIHEEYKGFPAATVRLSNMKACVGADLASMERELEKAEEAVKEMEAKEFKHSISFGNTSKLRPVTSRSEVRKPHSASAGRRSLSGNHLGPRYIRPETT